MSRPGGSPVCPSGVACVRSGSPHVRGGCLAIGALGLLEGEEMGATVLIVYATIEGQSAKVARFIGERVRECGLDAEVAAADELPDVLPREHYVAVIAGGSIHEGHHSPALIRFLARHRDPLATLPTAFFTVCLAVAGPDEQDRLEAERYSEDLVEATGWAPSERWLVAGALRYTQYSWLKRALMKRFANKAGHPVDTDRDVELTDWQRLEGQVDEFLSTIETTDVMQDRVTDEPRVPRILCAMDFSDSAMAALSVAVYMARIKGGRLRLVHVFNTPTYLEWSGGSGLSPAQVTYVDDLRGRLEGELRKLCDEITDVEAEPELVDGRPHAVLVELSAEADLMVMGTHGRKGVARALLGSVAERVVRGSHCPVLTVPVREQD